MNPFRLAACTGIALMLLLSCNTSKHAVAKRAPFAATPITVDGNDKDWPSPYPNYDSKAMISYAVTNDRDNLYLSIKASDPRMRQKILRGGMTVWIDTLGGSSRHLVIESPMPDAIAGGPAGQRRKRSSDEDADEGQQQRSAGWRKEMMLGAAQYSLSGFGACDGKFSGAADADNTCGIRLKLGINEYNELVWEAAIPFSAWHHRVLSQRDAGKALNICFEVAGVKMPVRTTGGEGGGRMGSGGMGGGGHMGGGGMGRGGGGRMGGGGGGTRSSGQSSSEEGVSMSQSTKTWVKTGLAYQ